jgi:hypothetical protein
MAHLYPIFDSANVHNKPAMSSDEISRLLKEEGSNDWLRLSRSGG